MTSDSTAQTQGQNDCGASDCHPTFIAPCLFCGTSEQAVVDGLAIIKLDHNSWYQVVCGWCGASGPPNDGPAKAVRKWNRVHDHYLAYRRDLVNDHDSYLQQDKALKALIEGKYLESVDAFYEAISTPD